MAFGRKDVLIDETTTWMNLEQTMPSEIRQTKGQTLAQNEVPREFIDPKRSYLARPWNKEGNEMGKLCLMNAKFDWKRLKKLWRWMVMVFQQNACA